MNTAQQDPTPPTANVAADPAVLPLAESPGNISAMRPTTRAAFPWKLTLAYDGTDFFGWQVQPGLRTVQGVLAQTVREITGEAVLPQGSGRTDTGVHAEGQVVSLPLRTPIPPDRLLRALNRRLPRDLRVLSVEDAGPEFHARANVVSKIYEYRIFERRVTAESRVAAERQERICSPFLARYVWDCRWPVDFDLLQHASQGFLGTHDFTSVMAFDPDRTARERELTGQPCNPVEPPRSHVRTIFQSDWRRQDGFLIYRVQGSGFLHHMVRNIVGTCVEAGAGRRDAASIPALLLAQDRNLAGATAPPQGLHLVSVQYAAPPAIASAAQSEMEHAR